MLRKSNAAQSISRPKYKNETLTTFQSAEDIIAALKRAEKESRSASQTLSKFFNESDKKKVAAKVWYFLRNELIYFAEPKDNQTAKTINRMLYDCTYNNGTVDCKHYSVFAVGVLNACNIPAWFTFAGQNRSVKKPNHAYCSCLIDGKIYTIDACRKHFNSECRYFYKWDIKRA